MKEEALKLADELDGLNSCEPVIIKACEDMIRRLVEELNKQEYRNKHEGFSGIIEKIGDCQIHDLVHRTTPQTKPLSDDEIAKIYHSENRFSSKGNFAYYGFARAIEERHGIK